MARSVSPYKVTNTFSPLPLNGAPAMSRVGNGRKTTASRSSKLSRRRNGSACASRSVRAVIAEPPVPASAGLGAWVPRPGPVL